jgi:hypothetical protein
MYEVTFARTKNSAMHEVIFGKHRVVLCMKLLLHRYKDVPSKKIKMRIS